MTLQDEDIENSAQYRHPSYGRDGLDPQQLRQQQRQPLQQQRQQQPQAPRQVSSNPIQLSVRQQPEKQQQPQQFSATKYFPVISTLVIRN